MCSSTSILSPEELHKYRKKKEGEKRKEKQRRWGQSEIWLPLSEYKSRAKCRTRSTSHEGATSVTCSSCSLTEFASSWANFREISSYFSSGASPNTDCFETTVGLANSTNTSLQNEIRNCLSPLLYLPLSYLLNRSLAIKLSPTGMIVTS